jgi:hypothetical protein
MTLQMKLERARFNLHIKRRKKEMEGVEEALFCDFLSCTILFTNINHIDIYIYIINGGKSCKIAILTLDTR